MNLRRYGRIMFAISFWPLNAVAQESTDSNRPPRSDASSITAEESKPASSLIDGWTRVALLGDAAAWTSELGKDPNASFGAGLMWATKRTSASLFIRKGTVDTITADPSNNRDIGSFLLTPRQGNISVAAQVFYTPLPWTFGGDKTGRRSRHGFYGAIQAGAASWVLAGTTQSRNAIGLAIAGGWVVRVGPESCEDVLNCWGVDLFVGLLHHRLMGDAGQDETFRRMALGKDARGWSGFEVGGDVVVNDVSIGMSLKFLGLPASNSIAGLTGGQLVPAVNVSVPIDVALSKSEKETAEKAVPSKETKGKETTRVPNKPEDVTETILPMR